MTAAGLVLGFALGGGLWLVWTGAPARRRPMLEARLAPYLTGLPTQTPATARMPSVGQVVRPYLERGGDVLERVLGGGASVRRRLDQAGSTMTVQEFRIDQVVWAAAGLGAGVLLSLLMQVAGRGDSPVLLLVICLASGVAGVVARDHQLTLAVRARERRMLAEFPTIADLLALAVAAGEGPTSALERVAKASSGELSRELSRALADARAGAGLVRALDRIGERATLPALARFADAVVVSIERGTPLADVLRAQAADVRDARKRHLMEVGGRKELLMMIPVIFLVLPITILFALYPGLIQISAIVP